MNTSPYDKVGLFIEVNRPTDARLQTTRQSLDQDLMQENAARSVLAKESTCHT